MKFFGSILDTASKDRGIRNTFYTQPYRLCTHVRKAYKQRPCEDGASVKSDKNVNTYNTSLSKTSRRLFSLILCTYTSRYVGIIFIRDILYARIIVRAYVRGTYSCT